MIDRRAFIGAGIGASALAASPALGAKESSVVGTKFPKNFVWGVATAGHQIEGNNVNSDFWLLENVKPTLFTEPSGDACDSFHRWREDIALVKEMGLNSYRFSIEWSRVEPEQGLFSIAMLDHYKSIIQTCRDNRIAPIVTFNHWTVPIWFACLGGWTNLEAPQLFARYCDRAARHLAAEIAYAITLNEPNGLSIANQMVPDGLKAGVEAMLEAARRATGSPKFVGGPSFQYAPAMQQQLLSGHRAGFDAIKAANPNLPTGFSLAIVDEQAGKNGTKRRDEARADFYGAWLETARADDFIGIQNYTRRVWNKKDFEPTPTGVVVNQEGAEVFPAALANCVRYAHEMTGRPVMVTEHGVAASDDRIRAALIPAALGHLRAAMADNVPVLGYLHWSLIDNFEWVSGYRITYGLAEIDRTSFARKLKPSAAAYAKIARANSL